MFQSEIVRWVSKDRWYHAYIVCDLLGDWTVVLSCGVGCTTVVQVTKD